MSKYRAVPTTIDNIRFDSKREAARYMELKLLFRAGKINNLEIQKPFDCFVDGTKIGVYKADFVYFDNGKRVVEDVKGVRTPLYRWKKKHVEAEYKVKIVEV